MLPPVCPSCGFLLADKELILNEKLNPKIFNNIMSSNENNNENQAKINEILKDLNIHRYCCRKEVLTTVDLISLYK